MSLLGRALKSIRHHRIATSILIFYDFIFLSGLLLLGCFMLYLLTSTEQLSSTINTIRTYDTSLYAKPFEELMNKTSVLFLNTRLFLIVSIFIGFISTICVQSILFRFRKQEYRSYLLLNEQPSKLCHQITIEQLILLNIALMSLFIFYVFFHSQLFTFFSRIETSILVSHSTKAEDTTIQSTSQPSSILDEHGFTRFHIRPSLIGTKNEHLFNLAIRHQFPIVVSFLNALSYCLIYLSNYVIFYVKKKNIL